MTSYLLIKRASFFILYKNEIGSKLINFQIIVMVALYLRYFYSISFHKYKIILLYIKHADLFEKSYFYLFVERMLIICWRQYLKNKIYVYKNILCCFIGLFNKIKYNKRSLKAFGIDRNIFPNWTYFCMIQNDTRSLRNVWTN